MGLVLDEIIGPDEPGEAVPEWELEDVELNGESWNLRLFWNDRSERWTIDMEKGDETRIQRGIKMVPNFPLGWHNTGREPEGVVLMLVDFGGEGREACTYEGLGHRWKLCSFTDDGEADTTSSPYTFTVP